MSSLSPPELVFGSAKRLDAREAPVFWNKCFPRCPWAQTKAQEVPTEHQEALFHCGSALAQVVQGAGEVERCRRHSVKVLGSGL